MIAGSAQFIKIIITCVQTHERECNYNRGRTCRITIEYIPG
jgi:hypothetical protein